MALGKRSWYRISATLSDYLVRVDPLICERNWSIVDSTSAKTINAPITAQKSSASCDIIMFLLVSPAQDQVRQSDFGQ